MTNAEKIAMAQILESQALKLRKSSGEPVDNLLAATLKSYGVEPKVFAAAWLLLNPKGTQNDLAGLLGVTRKTIQRWKKDGFDLKQHLTHQIESMSHQMSHSKLK